MSNIINDKLIPSDNVQFTPGEELSLRAYMQGKVKKCYLRQAGSSLPDYEIRFIDGQNFWSLIKASELGGRVCNIPSGRLYITNQHMPTGDPVYVNSELYYTLHNEDDTWVYDTDVVVNDAVYIIPAIE